MQRPLLAAAVVALGVLAVALVAWRHHHGRRTPVVVTRLAGEGEVLPRAPAAEPARAARLTESTLAVGGAERRYVLLTPEGYDPAAKLPLVLVFHGDGGTARTFHDAFPFEVASGAGAFVAYPDGVDRTWDLTSVESNADVAFVEALIGALGRALPIDAARVFLVGYSSGGFFSNLFACQRSALVRALSSSAGGAPYHQAGLWPNGFTRCPGQAPVAALALHGDSDFGVGLDSGRFSATYWAYVNGCDEGAMETTGYPECEAYRGCSPGKSVAFCEIPGLGHWVWDRAAEASWTFFLRASR